MNAVSPEIPSLERVLCALDVDAVGRGTLSVAGLIAERFRASVDALYAPEPLLAFGGRTERVRRLIAEHSARERLQTMTAPFSSSVRVSSFITRGRASSVILSHSEQHRSDLIVLGASSKRLFADSAAEIVMPVSSAASCAVLTVRGQTAECAMRRILLPVGPTLAEAAAASWAIALAQRFAARVDVVPFGDARSGFWKTLAGRAVSGDARRMERRPQARTELVMARLQRAQVDARELLLDDADFAGVVDVAESGCFDLVVMGLHARGDAAGDGEELLRLLRRRTCVPVLSTRAAGVRQLFARGGLEPLAAEQLSELRIPA
jgi:hypothetical protein